MTYTGKPYKLTQIEAYLSGWNYAGGVSEEKTVETNDNTITGTFYSWSASGWSGGKTLKPGYGFLFKVTQSTQLNLN